jgi:hypothetical protein
MLPSVDLSSCLWMLAKYHELTNMLNFLSYPFPRPQDQSSTSTTFWFFTTGWKAKRNYCRHCSSLYSCCSNIFIRGLPLVEMGFACETCNGMRNSGILVYISDFHPVYFPCVEPCVFVLYVCWVLVASITRRIQIVVQFTLWWKLSL